MSSISVYREFDCEVDEETHINKISLQYEAEEFMRESFEKLIILRLGGLMDNRRIAGQWSKATSFSDGYVNYVHLDDVIAIVKKIILNGFENELFNVVSPLHPLRSEVHKHNSKRFGFELGTFSTMTNRIVKSDKIINKLNYKFLYPDPLKFW